MAATPDHRAQICYRDAEVQIGSTGAATVVSGQGGLRYTGAAFQMLDGVGQFDPRFVYQLSHSQLNDPIHVLSGSGPILSGAVLVTTYVGGVFLSTETWYTNATRSVPISQHKLTYPAGSYVNPSTESWTIYDANGNVSRTVTDTLTFSGVTEVARTRSVT